MQHLEGITVLNEYIVYKEPWFLSLFFVMALVFVTIAVILAIMSDKSLFTIIFLCCSAICIVLLIIGCTGVWGECESIIYECLVDDGVTYKELTNTYKIIEQRGDIYVLKFLD